MKQKVGQVSNNERDQIKQLFERRNGLYELAKILTADNSELYEKLVNDLGETSAKFQNWWDTMSQKYKWKSCKDGNWEINFETCEIFLVNDTCSCKK
ncbi:MAG: CXXX repeat peptide modification system protein [Prevotellaceae bacterium]|nr:CXXX repeat peptide modification system protein [Candidatus Faecinaster equi]